MSLYNIFKSTQKHLTHHILQHSVSFVYISILVLRSFNFCYIKFLYDSFTGFIALQLFHAF